MSEPAFDSSTADVPFPPRFWWLKRIAGAAAVLLVLLAGAWLWWFQCGRQALREQVDAIRARGEPLLVEDFSFNPVPDAQNAAILYLQAADGMDTEYRSQLEQIIWPSSWPPPPQWMDVVGAEVADKSDLFPVIRRARALPQVQWDNKPLTSPLFNTLLPHLQKARLLASLLADAAIHAHQTDEHAEALEHLLDMTAISRALDEPPHFLVSRIVAGLVDALTADRAVSIAPDLSAPRDRVKQLIGELLDRSDGREHLWRALQSERAGQYDAVLWMTRDSWALRPMFDREALRMVRYMEGLRPAVEQRDFQSARVLFSPRPRTGRGPGRLTRVISGTMVFSLDRVVQREFQSSTELRLGAVALAVRLYVIDHGRYPPDLQALVPEYLPYVPKDPMAADDAELRYALLEGGLRPVVYSVGEDGRDQTATGVLPPAEPQYGWSQGSADQWRDLSRWTPPQE